MPAAAESPLVDFERRLRDCLPFDMTFVDRVGGLDRVQVGVFASGKARERKK
jgi:hypothetical protein